MIDKEEKKYTLDELKEKIKETDFCAGQKVFITYTSKDINPPARGIVMEKSKIRRSGTFTTFLDEKIDWFFVRMENGILCLVPSGRMSDLKERIEDHDKRWSICPTNKKTEIDAWLSLQKTKSDDVKYYYNIK